MTDRVREVVAGDPVRADEWNLIARVVNPLAAGRWRTPRPPVAGLALTPALDVLVRNDTGGPLLEGVPVKLGAALTGIVATPRNDDESRARPLFAGLACDATSVHGVTAEAVPADAIGRVVVMGCTVARVPAGAAAGSYASPPTSSNVALVAGGGFARLITPAVGSGDAAALVQIGGGGPAASTQRVRLVGAASGSAGAKSAARLTYRTGGGWADQPGPVNVWLVELNGGVLPDPTDGRAYLAYDTGADEAVGGDTRRVYAAVDPGLMTNWKCQDDVPLFTVTPVGVG